MFVIRQSLFENVLQNKYSLRRFLQSLLNSILFHSIDHRLINRVINNFKYFILPLIDQFGTTRMIDSTSLHLLKFHLKTPLIKFFRFYKVIGRSLFFLC